MISEIKIDKKYSLKFSNKIESLKDDWLRVKTNNNYLTKSYLQALELSISSGIKFIYVVVYRDCTPVGVLYFQWLKIGADFFSQEKFPEEIHLKKTSTLLKKLSGGLLLCGNFFATGANGYFFTDTLPPKMFMKIIKHLKSSLKRSTPSFKCSFLMFKEFSENEDDFVKKDMSKSYAPFEIDVNMVLSLDSSWESFQDYLLDMTTKYRTRVKSVLKKTSEFVVKDFNAEDIKFYQSDIERLYLSVVDTASFNLAKLSGNSFYEFKKQLKSQFVFTGYFYEDKLIAFSSGCLSNDCLDANYVGIDYELNKEIPLYQRILIDYVALAIREKVKELRLGRTAEIMKSSLGAKAIHMRLYVRHTNKLIHVLLKPLIGYVYPSAFEIRNPFKTQQIKKDDLL